MRSRRPGVGPGLLAIGLIVGLGACGFGPSGEPADAAADDGATIDGSDVDATAIDAATIDAAAIDAAAIDAATIDAAAVDATAVDAPPADAPTDAMPEVAAFAAATAASSAGSDNLSYGLNVPAGTSRYLLVSVQLGTNCVIAAPTVSTVSFNGDAMTRITSVVGTPCGPSTTRSEQWGLVAPDVGNFNVVVTLSGTANTVHSGAMAFQGISQAMPVRGFMTGSGAGTSSTVTVASVVGDLVVNTVGQGNSVTAPGGGQSQRYIHNVNTSNTLNNSAGSTAPGAASVTMTWTFGSTDEWQTISSSLRPGP